MTQLCRSFLVVLCALAVACQPLGPSRIPQAKPEGWVVDLSGLLSAEDIAELERLGDAVHAKDGAALMVLTVDSTGDEDPRRLATQVFNRWQLGDAVRDNGLLILVAPKDRAAEIVLGDGIASDADVAKSDRIMQQEMVPLFRDGENAGAILAGARACAAGFFGVANLPVEAPLVPRPIHPRPWRLPHPIAMVMAGLLALGSSLLGIAHWHRNRPRTCKSCRKKMIRLGEAEDDEHLEPGQRVEEKIGSVDHDVWACLDCGNVLKIAYGKFLSGYHRCPGCKNVTASNIEKTLRYATISATGLMQIDEKCKHCGYHATSTRTIPRISQSSSSGSSGSSGRSFSSGGSSGGGSSSGRGSSGRW